MAHDVMVVGAGVAGSAVAVMLAARDRRVLVIEKEPGNPAGRLCPDWLPLAGVSILDQLGLDRAAYAHEPLVGLVFHSPDLSRSITAREPQPAGIRLDYGHLVGGLRQRATILGAEFVFGETPACLDAAERQVGAFFDRRDPLSAGFMVLADGAARTWAESGGPPGRWVADSVLPSSGAGDDGCLHWVLGLDRGRSFGAWWIDRGCVVVRLESAGTAETGRQSLVALVGRLCDRGLVHADKTADTAVITVRPSPARPALEMESHVEKRSIRIGDAGGFFAIGSREGIYPALWSAQLTTGVLVGAADCSHPQDVLRQFSSLWRSQMGQYLGSPGADVQFLLPLILNNQQVADRMAQAFWRGQDLAVGG
jgi:flavin-dependent dehydrogenase